MWATRAGSTESTCRSWWPRQWRRRSRCLPPPAGAAVVDDNAPPAPAPGTPAFFYHLGDVIYYNGQSAFHPVQFYDPYKFFPPPIFAIPGNNDGNPRPGPNDPPDPEPSLFGFIHNFCDVRRNHVDNYRDTMTQPYVY